MTKRVQELAEQCWQRDIPTCTGFLDLEEQTVFHSVQSSLPPVSLRISGGFAEAERKAVCFLPSYADPDAAEVLPFSLIKIAPRDLRFAEVLTHRDYLGAIMHLGIERACIGDIIVKPDGAYVYCLKRMETFICSNLIRVRHTEVICAPCLETTAPQPEMKPVTGSAASMRADVLVGMAFRLARGKAAELIASGRVFSDGREVTQPGRELKPGMVISVRGMGKFRVKEVLGETRKGRQMVTLELFV